MDDIKKAQQGGDCTMLADMARNQREKARMLSDRLQEQGDRMMLRDAEAAVLREALAELVACKDLKARLRGWRAGSTQELADLSEEYDRRKPKAWERARYVLADLGAGITLLERVERMETLLRECRPYVESVTELDPVGGPGDPCGVNVAEWLCKEIDEALAAKENDDE